jgi:hypothetical protein
VAEIAKENLSPWELDSTYELNRVLRPVEVINHKYRLLVEMLRFNPERRYRLEDFERHIPPPPPPAASHSSASDISGTDAVAQAMRYIQRRPGCDSGNNRNGETMKVAKSLVIGFNLTISQSLPLIKEWNQKCRPNDFSPDVIEEMLRKKLEDADKNKDGLSRGGLLAVDDVDLSGILEQGPGERRFSDAPVVTKLVRFDSRRVS